MKSTFVIYCQNQTAGRDGVEYVQNVKITWVGHQTSRHCVPSTVIKIVIIADFLTGVTHSPVFTGLTNIICYQCASRVGLTVKIEHY